MGNLMPGRATAAPDESQRRPRGRELRQRILFAARNTFLDEGFEASMDTVAAAAATTKATVYKHFGNKEALFIAVIEEELDRALEEPVNLVASRLAQSSHVREDLIDACRAWASGLAAPDAISLRNLVAGEARRFPELGKAWHERGPQRFHPVIADALRRLVKLHRLSIANIDLAVLQLSGLVVSPNLVYSAYSAPVDADTRELLITAGVDMFINHYQYRANV
ncbi:TetR/AcrR family transcriptional regulator C-terminal domain-containing protein [Streptomyces sp. NBC_00882]|uniref:TetR/AcrR family transcriptional regulator n=1 Tax=Streptomyces TaxID=1883 RepID=UPI0038652CBE|nr:TetR/AcrR family transcriptional regulator C-terminal domain-containing protein [Streptomyces sp. NBC_00882]WSZ56251.1 TetR/AcrR family transcriptional regulator C-terminal domain-containing protein [Streptomyces canus]